MHRALTFTIRICALLALSACHGESVAGSSVDAPSSSHALDTMPFDQPAFDTKAKAFVDAALTYTETCNLQVDAPKGWFDFISFDVCSTKHDDLAPVEAAGKAFDGLDPTLKSAPLEAVALFERIKTFRSWALGISKIKVTRGTMRIYQDLALAYDAYRPEAKVPTEPKHALDQYFVVHPERSVAYIWEQTGCYDKKTYEYVGCDPTHDYVRMDRYAIHRQRGTPLQWNQSPQGPFLPD